MFKVGLIASLVLLATFAAASAGLRLYRNDRYGFTIGVPGLFTKSDHAAQNGDGNTWYSQDGFTQLAVYGSNDGGMRLEDAFRDDILSVPSGAMIYQQRAKNWFVISWSNRDRIVYEKTFVGPASMNSFTLTYPRSREAEMRTVVPAIEKSFRPGDLNIAH